MIRIILAIALALPGTSLADGILQSAMEGAIRATSNHMRDALCDPGTTFADTPQCYMTPSGKHVFELQEPERSEWMKIARERAEEQNKRESQDQNHQRLETQRVHARAEENALHCDFWSQQADSERTRMQIERYCP